MTLYEPAQITVSCNKKLCQEKVVFKGAKFADWEYMNEELKRQGFSVCIKRKERSHKTFHLHYCRRHTSGDKVPEKSIDR